MLNERIRVLRKNVGLSQVELAKKLGVTKQCVSNWENDNIQPSVEMLVKIACLFGVTTDYILGLQSQNVISVDGLTDSEVAHIRLIVNDLKMSHKGLGNDFEAGDKKL